MIEGLTAKKREKKGKKEKKGSASTVNGRGSFTQEFRSQLSLNNLFGTGLSQGRAFKLFVF